MARGGNEEEGTYQIRYSISDDDEMRNLTHWGNVCEIDEVEKVVSDEMGEEEETTRRYFVSTISTKPMTAKVYDLLNSFKIPSSSYNDVLSTFDNMLILMTCSSP